MINITLNVENASEATSKFGNSTNLKNNSKQADSKMYLKRHYVKLNRLKEKSRPLRVSELIKQCSNHITKRKQDIGFVLLSKTWEFNAFPKHTSTMQSYLLVVIAAHKQ